MKKLINLANKEFTKPIPAQYKTRLDEVAIQIGEWAAEAWNISGEFTGERNELKVEVNGLIISIKKPPS